MKIVHLALLYLSFPPQTFRPFRARIGEMEVSIFPQVAQVDGKTALILTAITSAQVGLAGNIIKVSEETHLELESALESLANLISVKEGTGREIKAPGVNIALIPETSEDEKMLSSAKFLNQSQNSLGGVKPEIKMDYVE